jgi:hypothetical protein
MNAQAKLHDVQTSLTERGVVDVKFCFSEAKEIQLSHVAEDVSAALSAYNEGRFHAMPSFNDSVRSK